MLTVAVCFRRFYSSPYSISTNRMIAQTSITPFLAASPVSTYQVGGPSLTRLLGPIKPEQFTGAPTVECRTGTASLVKDRARLFRWNEDFCPKNIRNLLWLCHTVCSQPEDVVPLCDRFAKILIINMNTWALVLRPSRQKKRREFNISANHD